MRIFSPRNISRNDYSDKKKSRFSWRLFGKIILGLFLAGVLGVVGVFAFFYKDLPDPKNLNNRFVAESTKIYDRTGTHLLYDIHGEEKRTQIDFSQIPDTVKYATIALEDQNFYTNHGIEISSIIRAGIADILHRKATQGASTISQQLIKQTILTPEKTLTRKAKEAILSLELDRKFSKDEILGMYLNQIPYGSNAYGIESASQTFFGKHASDLTLDEAALLSALPQAPSYYSPYGSHTDALKGRQEYALNQMAKLGYITQEQADAAKQVDVLSKIKPTSENIAAPHFVMYVKEYLEQKYGDTSIEEGGLKVYTTLDWDKQQIAEQAVKDGAAKNDQTYKAANAGLVAMDPKTGQILAMVGSKDYFGKSEPTGCTPGKNCTFEPNVNVATALLQPGSSFKPYVYLTAFEKGFTPETDIWDVDTNFSTDDGQTYNPKNYDGKNNGLLEMKDALARSLNVPAVKTLYLAGVKDSIATAKSMGITTLNQPDRYGLSLVLGGGEVRLLDHVNAYSTFATGGIHHDTVAVLRVEDSKGNILEKYSDAPGARVIDQRYIAMIDYILSTNALRAPTFGNNSPLSFSNRPVAAKTGTTNEWRDGWTIGYTPSLVAGVWAGNNDHSIMKPGSDGVYVAAPIWRAFMDKALANTTTEDFPKYEQKDTGKDVLDGKLKAKVSLKVCKISDKKYCLPSGNSCPDGKKAKKKTFSDAHSILYYINKDDVLGDKPKNPDNDPQYDNWEKAVKAWFKDKGYSTDNTVPTEKCSGSDSSNDKISVDITSPSDGDVVDQSQPLHIETDISAPAGIKKANLSINDGVVASSTDGNLSVDYEIPSGTTKLLIKLEATDNNDNTDSDSATVTVYNPPN